MELGIRIDKTREANKMPSCSHRALTCDIKIFKNDKNVCCHGYRRQRYRLTVYEKMFWSPQSFNRFECLCTCKPAILVKSIEGEKVMFSLKIMRSSKSWVQETLRLRYRNEVRRFHSKPL